MSVRWLFLTILIRLISGTTVLDNIGQRLKYIYIRRFRARDEWQDCNQIKMKSDVQYIREKMMTILEATLYCDVPKNMIRDKLLNLLLRMGS